MGFKDKVWTKTLVLFCKVCPHGIDYVINRAVETSFNDTLIRLSKKSITCPECGTSYPYWTYGTDINDFVMDWADNHYEVMKHQPQIHKRVNPNVKRKS